jgi:hypothetical protein
MQRKGQLTNLWTYIILIVIVVAFVYLIQGMGAEVASNANANLSDKSLAYIGNVSGIDALEIARSSSDLNETIQDSGADSGTDLDFDFGFLATRAKAKEILGALGGLYTLPETVLLILGLPAGKDGVFSIFADIFNFVVWAGLIFGIIYLWKGAK